MKYKLDVIRQAFSRTLIFLPMDTSYLWEDFEKNLDDIEHEKNTDKVIRKLYGKKETRRRGPNTYNTII